MSPRLAGSTFSPFKAAGSAVDHQPPNSIEPARARERFRSTGRKVLKARAPQLTNVTLEAVSELVVDFHLFLHGLREKGLCLVERSVEHILRHSVVRDVEEAGRNSSLLQ
jgi:hypothetical protein